MYLCAVLTYRQLITENEELWQGQRVASSQEHIKLKKYSMNKETDMGQDNNMVHCGGYFDFIKLQKHERRCMDKYAQSSNTCYVIVETSVCVHT